ncbi:hypothetical protein F7725_025986 [Dissostichus mawsoni]|uniref:Uncharacterized protein n=1 Tax=Dissostichus mawsoni TaxID=36200 RepID=A0A7J5X5S8_DISMA|nr:hypothetical protein F7725_025986 [Dissostichus mawsoni]
MAHSVIDQAPHSTSCLFILHTSGRQIAARGILQQPVCLSEHPRCGRAPLSSVCDSNFTQPGPSVPEVTRQSDSELRGGVCSNGRGSRTFLPGFLHSLENPPHITTIVRATLLPQSKDQNSSHVFSEQMSSQLGWCEHRYNADRKPRQSLVEPIMGRARVNRKWVPFSVFAIFSKPARAALGSMLCSLSRLPVSPPMGELPPFPILPDMCGMPPFWMTEISFVFIARPFEKAAAYWFQKLAGSPLLALEDMLAPRKAIGPSTESLRPRLAGALFHIEPRESREGVGLEDRLVFDGSKSCEGRLSWEASADLGVSGTLLSGPSSIPSILSSEKLSRSSKFSPSNEPVSETMDSG